MPKMMLMSLIWDHRLCYSQIYTAFNVFVYSEKKKYAHFCDSLDFARASHKIFFEFGSRKFYVMERNHQKQI